MRREKEKKGIGGGTSCRRREREKGRGGMIIVSYQLTKILCAKENKDLIKDKDKTYFIFWNCSFDVGNA